MNIDMESILKVLKSIVKLPLNELRKLTNFIENFFKININTSLNKENNSDSQKTEIVNNEPVLKKTQFNVVIKSYKADKKVKVLKEIRSLTGLGITEAKNILESLPKVICEGVSEQVANETKELLENAGSTVSVE